MEIETDRLILREMTRLDYGALCKIVQDEAVMYAYEGAFTKEETDLWFLSQRENYQKWGFGLWAAVEKKSDRMIGQCGITLQPYRERQVLEIGYLFQKAFWGQGYATEGAIACKKYAFQKLQAQEVFSIIRDTNLPSQKVAQRNGMRWVDTILKHYRGINMPHKVFSVKAQT
ncbi:MAG: GNAT family N-acetyltransferase [Clostridiales bacterium]|nr:GNAT family N-acetyltransferase [Clostridiales bacterium]